MNPPSNNARYAWVAATSLSLGAVLGFASSFDAPLLERVHAYITSAHPASPEEN